MEHEQLSTTGQMAPAEIEKQARLREIRSKEWDKSTDSEKVEKLKMAYESINHLNYTISNLQSEIFRLKQHSHKDNGEVVVLLSSVHAQGVGSVSSMRNPLS